MKLSKALIKAHEECEELLKKDVLTYDEKVFVYKNWLPSFNNNIGSIGAFFTPFELAQTFTLEINGFKIIDLCAGIGILSFVYYHDMKLGDFDVDITCIEKNPEYVRVGRKLLPEANWICADVLDKSLYENLSSFHCVISNPPYGKIKTDTDCDWLNYKGSEFEYKVMEVGHTLSNCGVFLIPRGSSPFIETSTDHKEVELNKFNKFKKETGINIRNNSGICLDDFENEWCGTRIKTEIVTFNKVEDDLEKNI